VLSPVPAVLFFLCWLLQLWSSSEWHRTRTRALCEEGRKTTTLGRGHTLPRLVSTHCSPTHTHTHFHRSVTR
jgi:hypothetical protein